MHFGKTRKQKTTVADVPLDIHNSKSFEFFGLCTVFDKMIKYAAASIKHDTFERSLAVEFCSVYELTTTGFGFRPRMIAIEKFPAGPLAFCPDTPRVAVGLTAVL